MDEGRGISTGGFLKHLLRRSASRSGREAAQRTSPAGHGPGYAEGSLQAQGERLERPRGEPDARPPPSRQPPAADRPDRMPLPLCPGLATPTGPPAPPQLSPSDWDPMAGWLTPPHTPAGAGGGAHAEPLAPATGGPGPTSAAAAAAHSDKSGLAAAWSKLRRRFGRGSGSRGRLTAMPAGAAAPHGGGGGPSRPALLHTTGSAPVGQFYAQPQQPGWPSGGSTHNSPMPGPPPYAGVGPLQPAQPHGTRGGGGSSSSMLLRMPSGGGVARARSSSAGGYSADASSADVSTARRLHFSPPWGQQHGSSQPIPIAGSWQQGRSGSGSGHQRRPSWQQEGGACAAAHGAQHSSFAGQPAAQQGSYGQQQYGMQPGMAPQWPQPGSLQGAGSYGSSGPAPAAQALAAALLGPPARSGLAGRWVREAEAGGGGAGGGAAGDDSGAADVDFLLAIPQLQAAARERTRELRIAESEGELALEWVTQLRNGARVRRREALPKNGALVDLPRLDGRAGGSTAQVGPVLLGGAEACAVHAAHARMLCSCPQSLWAIPASALPPLNQPLRRAPRALPPHPCACLQLSWSIDGSVSIKAVQGAPLPALVQHKLRLRWAARLAGCLLSSAGQLVGPCLLLAVAAAAALPACAGDK